MSNLAHLLVPRTEYSVVYKESRDEEGWEGCIASSSELGTSLLCIKCVPALSLILFFFDQLICIRELGGSNVVATTTWHV